jgi:membrane protein YqaA with SNARE-associated domain
MGTWALGIFSFLDSSVFPIPPAFLQVALSIERPRRSFWYALVIMSSSVAGAVLGYVIGYALWDAIGIHIVGPVPPEVQAKFHANFFAAAFAYSFLPFPYKLLTIGSGFLHLHLPTLLLASTIGRSMRFFLIGALCFFWGRSIKGFLEKYFNLVCVGVGLLVAGVIVALKLLVKA